MIGDYKEVFFDIYCPACEHYRKPEVADPCAECLDNPAMVDSHKPLNFKKNEHPDSKKRCNCDCKCK